VIFEDIMSHLDRELLAIKIGSMNETQIALERLRGRVLQLQMEGKLQQEVVDSLEGDMECIEKEVKRQAGTQAQQLKSVRDQLDQIDIGLMFQSRVSEYEAAIRKLREEVDRLREEVSRKIEPPVEVVVEEEVKKEEEPAAKEQKRHVVDPEDIFDGKSIVLKYPKLMDLNEIQRSTYKYV